MVSLLIPGRGWGGLDCELIPSIGCASSLRTNSSDPTALSMCQQASQTIGKSSNSDSVRCKKLQSQMTLHISLLVNTFNLCGSKPVQGQPQSARPPSQDHARPPMLAYGVHESPLISLSGQGYLRPSKASHASIGIARQDKPVVASQC